MTILVSSDDKPFLKHEFYCMVSKKLCKYSATKTQRHKKKIEMNSKMDKLHGFLISLDMPFIKTYINRLIGQS